ncbi:MAG: RNA polymerase factor sigma-54 [Campylobacterota bacterium]|nr:RNA polymerase factor sigma-54 [Campylobacterota bacterium]
MSLNFQVKQKQSLQLSLKTWLPLLQAPLQELDTLFKEYSYENPFLEVNSHFESSSFSNSSYNNSDENKRGFIENMSLYNESIYEKIDSQISAPLFPTPNSQKVAQQILFYINDEGYFEGNIESIANRCKVTNEFAESIRQRFTYIEPLGVGAYNMTESFLFQLSDMDIDEELYKLSVKIIENLKNIDKYHKHHRFEEAKDTIKKFNNPPAVNYLADQPYIIPDFFVEVDDDITLKINNDYYPDIVVSDPFKTKNVDIKAKLKEARDLVNLLELRKSTLYKLILVIVEKQIGFFIGSELKPLTMSDIASELGFEESTISRAVSNKYIKCSRGIYPLKYFFTNAVSKNLSSSEIKNFIRQLIENEDKNKPMTDQDIVDNVIKRYNMKMVRRTITKYRKILDIPSSKERKKIYIINS